MSNSKSGTKRIALRFKSSGHFLRYKTEFEDGEAQIVNISTGGCALQETTVPLTLNEKILVLLMLNDNEDPLEISGRVKRIDGTLIAVQFLSLAEECKQRMVKYFVKKQHAAP